ncbi:MAG: MerR family transcriptional regulator [Chloroflexota bacterium]
MELEEQGLSVEELADLVGVPVRTVRYYIAEGLLPGPGSRGKGTVYSAEHLARLRLIRLLVERRLPLAEIRERTAGLSARAVEDLLAAEDRQARERRQTSRTPRDYIALLLEQARGAGQPAVIREAASPAWPPRAEEAAPSLAEPPAQSARRAEAAGEAWQHWQLLPGLELHARADTYRQHRKLIERLLAAAREHHDQK